MRCRLAGDSVNVVHLAAGDLGNRPRLGCLATAPVYGLILLKIIAAGLAAFAIFLHRKRVILFLNYWFAAVITWNLIAIWLLRFQ